MKRTLSICFLLQALPNLASAQVPDPSTASAPKPDTSSVSSILQENDRALVRRLEEYLEANATAEDRDEAHIAIFERAIARDWFETTAPLARTYLEKSPDGTAAPLARIVDVLALARSRQFPQALGRFRELMNRLEGAEQEPFALSFTEELALEAVAAGEPAIARGAYQTLLDRFRASDTVRDKAPAELARLDLIGRPVPQFEVRDLARETITADTYKGKYVLIDVWATWCAPCLAELPRLLSLEATYRDRGLVVIGLSLDESVEGLRDFVAARAIPWRQVHQATSGGDLAGALRITNLPCSILIQPDGTIARLDLRGEALERFLADTFAPKDSPEAKTRSAAPNEEEP